jgi:secreted trypsin-like serine protease
VKQVSGQQFGTLTKHIINYDLFSTSACQKYSIYSKSKIIGGVDADLGEYPHMVTKIKYSFFVELRYT